MSWSSKTTIVCLLPAEMGARQISSVMQSMCFLCCRAHICLPCKGDRQTNALKMTEPFLIFTLFASTLSACTDRSVAVSTVLPCWEEDVVKCSLFFLENEYVDAVPVKSWQKSERACAAHSFVDALPVSHVPVPCLCW